MPYITPLHLRTLEVPYHLTGRRTQNALIPQGVQLRDARESSFFEQPLSRESTLSLAVDNNALGQVIDNQPAEEEYTD